MDDPLDVTPPAPDLPAIITAEVRQWRAEGLISPAFASRLLARYAPAGEPLPPPSPDAWPRLHIPVTPGLVLLLTGGLLVVSAVAMLLANAWEDLGESGRAAVAVAPTFLLFAWAGWLRSRSPEQRSTTALLTLFACLLTPFALWLLLDPVFCPGTSTQAEEPLLAVTAGLSLLIDLGALAIFRSPLLTIPYPLTTIWLVIQLAVLVSTGSREAEAIGGLAIAGGACLLVAGWWATHRRRPAYAAVPDLVGSLMAMVGLNVLASIGDHSPLQLLMALASIGLIAASVWRRNQAYLFTGALYTVISVFVLGFEYFEDTAGLPATLIVCGLLSMGIGFAVQRVRKEYLLADEPD